MSARVDAVALDHVRRRAAAVGQGRAMRHPHRPLGVAACSSSIPRRSMSWPWRSASSRSRTSAQLLAGNLSPQVGQPLLGPAHVGDQHPQQIVGQAHRRDHDTLLDQLARADRHAGGHASRRRRRGGRARRRSRGRPTRETSVMSGRCVPPVYGSLTMISVAGLEDRARDRPRRRRASRRGARGCARPGRPSARDASNTAVEQSRRSLMLGEWAARTSAAPISSATPSSAAAITLRVAGSVIARAPIPPRPGAPASPRRPTGGTVERDRRGASRLRAGRRWSDLEGRAGDGGRATDRDQLDLARLVGEAVPLAMRLVKSRREPRGGLERHRQLERLAAVAQVARHDRVGRPTLAGQRGCEPAELRRASEPSGSDNARDGVSTTVANRDSKRRVDTTRRRAPTPAGCPSASATSQACRGPAPPKATSSRSRGSWPRSTVTTRIAATISWFATARIPRAAAARPRNPAATLATAGAPPCGRAATRRRAPPDGRAVRARGLRRSRSAACRRGHSRPARDRPPPIAARPAVLHRRRSRRCCRRRLRRCECPAGAGARAGRPRAVVAIVRPLPERIRQTSVEVPPMSKLTASTAPPATTAATPPAGPESSSRAPWSAASESSASPPLDCITNGCGRPTTAAAAPSCLR